ncbi:unnamed protein product [Cylindrotheca closterium]|uniref:Uncharacterized protein n=1 Tax=Cylindrotheca closterium TaxID=2856 RepID=A0AAD2FDL9_9STRA|nr:unnamed protein product [Cylindrotheca closterium]
MGMQQQQQPLEMMRHLRTTKRKRPWDRTTKMATITVLLLSSLWAPTACGEESLLFRQSERTKSPRQSSGLTKDFAPFVFNMRMEVTNSVDFNELLGQLNSNMEAYLFEELLRYGGFVDYLTIRAVTLEVTLLVRRRIQQEDFLRRRIQESTRIVSVEVEGATHYEVDDSQVGLETVKSQVLQEVDALLTVKEVGRSIMSSDTVENVVQVTEVSLNEAIEDDDDGDDDLVANDATGIENKIEKPTTLEMVVGFTLLTLMVLSWVFYGYLFWQKREKRLARKNRPQPKPNLPQNLKPARKQTAPSPSNKHGQRPLKQYPPLQATPQKQDTDIMKILPTTSSDDSSYKEDTNGPIFEETNPFADTFTQELDVPSKRDDEAWAKLRQKQSAFDGNFVDMNAGKNNDKKAKKSNSNSMTPFTPYSPYGDGAQEGVDFSLDDISNWEPYGISNPKTEEKKEDAWGTASAFSVGSSAFSDAFGMDLSQMGGSVNADRLEQSSVAGSEASSMMLEVQKLTQYVQRYEKRKERKMKREKEIETRSSEGSGADMNYLKNLKMSVDQRTRDKNGRGHVSFTDANSHANSSASGTSLKEAGANLTNQLLQKSRSPPAANRFGFSPFQEDFKVETVMEEDEEYEVEEEKKPRASYPIDTSTEPARPRSRSFGDRPQYKNTFYAPPTNSAVLDKYKAATDSKRKRLEALRSNTAIIDSSKSDVNVGSFGGFLQGDTPAAFSSASPSQFAERAAPSLAPAPRPAPAPRSPPAPLPATNAPARQYNPPRPRTNSSSNFASARSMFEQKSQAPIFPSGQFF